MTGKKPTFFDSLGGVLLFLASGLALVIANSSWQDEYHHILNDVYIGINLSGFADGAFDVKKSFLHWINDGLMAVFFLMVGLEIKKEFLLGELSTRAKAMLPVAAAIGGMVVPALVYFWLNQSHPKALAGWAIPCATDIAFALAVLAMLGSRAPFGLKILLTAIAIIDDLGAIAIIAIFYADDLYFNALVFSTIPIAGLFLLNKFNVSRRWPYIVFGMILWAAVLQSGVHATMAGVITAMFVPVRIPGELRSPAGRLEFDLHPWVSFLIVPLFGFANAGISFAGMKPDALLQPVTLGIILGLFIGKQLGVFGAMWLCVKMKLCPKPDKARWIQLYGISLLCGVGFTMSLFIGGLAFPGLHMQEAVRLGVLAGSLLSAVAGYIILRSTTGKA